MTMLSMGLFFGVVCGPCLKLWHFSCLEHFLEQTIFIMASFASKSKQFNISTQLLPKESSLLAFFPTKQPTESW
jgi:hypothetical protein